MVKTLLQISVNIFTRPAYKITCQGDMSRFLVRRLNVS